MPSWRAAVLVASLLPGTALAFQQSGVVAPLGKLNVPAKQMTGRCTTMVTPNYPQGAVNRDRTTVVVQAVIWKSGAVTPMHVVAGERALENEAMNAVRLWHYKPYARDGQPLDVMTDLTVEFDPKVVAGTVTHPVH
jgi:TonB family protein